jgi:GPI-anchor transamidase subunit S
MATTVGGIAASANPIPDAITTESAIMGANPPNSAVASHALPPEKPEAIRTRTRVILAFWVVIIFFGLPMWWKTTSVYRASLPLDEMMSWAEGKVRFLRKEVVDRE